MIRVPPIARVARAERDAALHFEGTRETAWGTKWVHVAVRSEDRRRNDAESINWAIDDTLWLRRAHSLGHARQHLNLLTHALMVNSLALHRHRRRDEPLESAA